MPPGIPAGHICSQLNENPVIFTVMRMVLQ